ncbi:MAG: glycine cleavage system protein GcvH [Streptosporangiales bacterium]|nr:glycine cleavage system protein GcvH [Streptosporangiales bacterium]
MYPDDLKYTSDHEWVSTPDGDVVRAGITQYAQDALGDIVFVSLPEVGEEVEPGQAIGEVESTKSVSDIFAPLAGTIAARNEALDGQPDLVNSDPYGEGWMVEIRVRDRSAVDALMDADAYAKTLES